MAVPLNYNPTPLTLLAGGTIRAMSGGGDGGAPPRYDPNPLTAYVNPSSTPINVYTGGGPNNIQHISAGTIATHEATTAATVPATAATAATSTNTTEASEKKQISLGGLRLSIGPPPWNLKEGTNEMEALAWFGVDKAPDVKLKEEVLDALYEGVCDTDKPLIMVLECEPIRRLVQSLAEKLLGNLTRPVVKKTSAEIAAIAEQQKKKAKLMSFNVFKNQCKTKTAKDYIDKSDADIVCTQQDTKTEFTNYTEIKACGDANSATRVYLRKNTPFKLDIECIEGDHSAAIFTYQGVTIVNMGSSNQELVTKILEKKPNIILGSVNDIVLSNEWIRADTINKDLNTTEAIWYKKEDELFELKNTTVDNIKVKGDDYTKPELCSYSDHNPITAEIHFKKTLKQLASNADEAAKVAAASSQITSTPNSGIVSTLGLTPHMSSSTINQLTESELLQKNAAKKLEEATALETAKAAVELDDELAKKIAVAAVAAMLQEDEEQGIASRKSARAASGSNAAEPAVLQMPISSTAISTQSNSVPVEKIASAAAATVAALSNAADPSIAVPVDVEEISDELAKKIAVAAVAVMLQNSNQGSIAQSGIATSVTPKTHEQLLANSINGLNNNQMSVNNEQHIVHYNEAPHGNELESPHNNHSEIQSSTSLPNSSPVVLHDEINKPKSITVSLPTNVTASPVEVHPSYNNELDSVLELANNADKASSQSTYQPSKSIPRSTSDVPSATILPSTEPLGNGNTTLLTKTKEKTTTSVKERSGNPSINLTENFRKRNALTAELKKPKKILGLNQQIKNEGTIFSKSRVEEPVAEPIVEPVAKPTMKSVPAPMTNSLNALMAAPKKIVSEKVALAPNQQPQRKLLRIHGRIEATKGEILKHINDINGNNDPLQTSKRMVLNTYISMLNSFLPEIIQYEKMNPEHYKNDRINNIDKKIYDIIEKVHNIIYPKFGGRRRTQKKRKQKKQKKHFGTQKK